MTAGRTQIILYQSSGAKSGLGIYFRLLAAITAIMGWVALWRAIGLRRRMLDRECEPTA
jgi:hypothetical protein